MPVPVKLVTTVERKHPKLPCFLVNYGGTVAGWSLNSTTVVECVLNGIDMGRRTIKRWDGERWFIDLTESQCKRAQVDIGDQVDLVLRIAPIHLPTELARLLAEDSAAKASWDKPSASKQRILREHIMAARQPATRKRRAVLALGK